MIERDLELLNAYLDGALDANVRAELERRLESSVELRAELESLRALDQSLRESPRPASLSGSDDALIDKLRGTPAVPPSRISWPIVVGLTLAALLALLVLAAVTDEIATILSTPHLTPPATKNVGKKAPAGIATITFARGEVIAYSPASKDGDVIESGARLDRGVHLAASDRSNAIVTLDGGGVLYVMERTQLDLAGERAANLTEGNLVATTTSGAPLAITGEGVTLKLATGTCELSYDDPSNAKLKGPRRLRITLLTGKASIGDLALVPGKPVFVRDGVIVR